jgi:hypothetical protein
VALRERLATAHDEAEGWEMVDAAGVRDWAARHHDHVRRTPAGIAARVARSDARFGRGD